jgi:hypothetical protein
LLVKYGRNRSIASAHPFSLNLVAEWRTNHKTI